MTDSAMEAKSSCGCTKGFCAESNQAATDNDQQPAVDGNKAGIHWGRVLWFIWIPAAGFGAWLLESLGPADASWLRPLVFMLYLGSYVAAGFAVFRTAFANIIRGRVFDEMFLMTIASLGAFAIGAMEEAIGVMAFYRIGEYFMEKASNKSGRSIKALLSLQPDSAHCLRDGSFVDIAAAEVQPGDIIQVRPGERVPVDGIILEGSSNMDTRSMTGEAMPRAASAGSEVLSGFIALDGMIKLECRKIAAQSSAAKILELVQKASQAKARTELIISRFARWYTPGVVVAAALLALVPPSLQLITGSTAEWSVWLYRALVMLVISCPCALVMSVPLGYFAGLGGAARQGILVKGARFFDALADAKTVVFDKTGTLSDGVFRIQQLVPADGQDRRSLLQLALQALQHSNHPLAQAVRTKAAEDGIQLPEHNATDEFREIAGRGLRAIVGASQILAGNRRLLEEAGVAVPAMEAEGSVVLVAKDSRYAGYLLAGDSPKPGAAAAVGRLKQLGVRRLVLLSGDTEAAANSLAVHCGIHEVHAGLLPQDKLQHLEAILAEQRGSRGSVLFAGDGTNDAPVLARADAGLAMGKTATDAALESADVVLLSGEPDRVPEAIRRARHTRSIIIQNIVFALSVKLLFLTFGGLGLASMWEAVIADVGVALLAILNASRALR
ncbi:MAG: cadmium-translocating P-type ATPase [Spirochaetes bacterium]|nr:cadmium-translocating P-type ATPase [Spirochaetota bacterium]MBU0957022.1 cadmium-translocating P-type ATPase [Spirochaetota bacterium]